jgi:hypothetical protein
LYSPFFVVRHVPIIITIGGDGGVDIVVVLKKQIEL